MKVRKRERSRERERESHLGLQQTSTFSTSNNIYDFDTSSFNSKLYFPPHLSEIERTSERKGGRARDTITDGWIKIRSAVANSKYFTSPESGPVYNKFLLNLARRKLQINGRVSTQSRPPGSSPRGSGSGAVSSTYFPVRNFTIRSEYGGTSWRFKGALNIYYKPASREIVPQTTRNLLFISQYHWLAYLALIRGGENRRPRSTRAWSVPINNPRVVLEQHRLKNII